MRITEIWFTTTICYSSTLVDTVDRPSLKVFQSILLLYFLCWNQCFSSGLFDFGDPFISTCNIFSPVFFLISCLDWISKEKRTFLLTPWYFLNNVMYNNTETCRLHCTLNTCVGVQCQTFFPSFFLFRIENVICFSRIYSSESFESSNQNTIFGYCNKFLCHWHHNIDFIEPILYLNKWEPQSFSIYQTFLRSANNCFKGNFSISSICIVDKKKNN